MKKNINLIISICLSVSLLTLYGCRKWVEVEAPATSTNAENAYKLDATAISVLTGIYAKLSSTDDFSNLSANAGLSADELTLWNTNNTEYQLYYRNQLNANITFPSPYWYTIYPYLYTINSAIEGLNTSSSLSPTAKSQLLGEAYFMRAFCLFYLVNLYGDVPIPLTADYKVNSSLPRTHSGDVFRQINKDLLTAKPLLNPSYQNITLTGITSERVRPNRFAAAGLLARTYLYTGNYANAEIEASLIIDHKELYDTVGLQQVFLKNSKEAIWQLQPVLSGVSANTHDGRLFLLPPTGPSNTYPLYLSKSLTSKFDADDLRKKIWMGEVSDGMTVYEYPMKYKIGAEDKTTEEYLMVMRLAEQYLIRAEARAKLGNITGSRQDLNVIRKRAGLIDITASSEESLVAAVIAERQRELFTEWGHRWFDLKRSGKLDQIMVTELPNKGGGSWDGNKALYPIPAKEISMNRNITQNPGY